MDLTYPLAELDGETVWAANLATGAERPMGLTCISYGGPMSLRAGEHRRAHFAHRTGAVCASGETALHALAIRRGQPRSVARPSTRYSVIGGDNLIGRGRAPA